MKKAFLGFFVFFFIFSFFNLYNVDSLVWELRMSRVLAAFACGAGLSLAGAFLQLTFNNPLCDPYILGISSWAVLGAILGLIFESQFGMNFGALFGGVVSSMVLLYFTHRFRLRQTPLLLFGVIMGLLGGAASSCALYWTKPELLQSAWSWMLGDLGRPSLNESIFLNLIVFIAVLFAIVLRKRLEPLYFQDEVAETYGINLNQSRQILLSASSLLVALIVAKVGVIGFVGLVCPFIARKWVGARFVKFIPTLYLSGGAFLLLADWGSRDLIYPREIPVGIITTIIGAPIFILILFQKR